MRTFLLLLFIFLSLGCFSQNKYKGLPVIKAEKSQADYRIGNKWTKGSWGINADISPDALNIPTFSKTMDFGFYTDKDSISFKLDGNTVKQFYVLTAEGRYALTEIRGFDFLPVKYENAGTSMAYKFYYENGKPNAYLEQFERLYPLEEIIKGHTSDSAKALRILKWVHDQWNHDGSNEPKKKDAISILEEVKEGKNFRCVEYGIVGTAALNAIGLPARVLALKTKDVETTESGAGHVLMEVYLKDMKKWVLMDGQIDVMPVLNNIPLNAVEFQHAIATNYDKLQIRSLSGASKEEYIKWIYPYLYYLDIKFDNREGIDLKREKYDGKSSLMLIPKGAKQPAIFQKKSPINYAAYTSSVNDFYAPPVLN